jgi:recombination protein RecA
MSLQDIQNLIKKNVKGVHVSVMSESDLAVSSGYIQTPSLDLNRILSGNLFKGIPNRQLVGIVGPEHTMKSSFMVLCMVNAIREGYTPIIIDTEGGVKSDFCTRWGLDLSKVMYIYTPWISEIQSVLANIKKSGEKKIIIGLDSVGGIEKLGAYESALGGDPKSDQGQLQKQIRSMLKLLLNICIEQESIGIVTSHLYSRPGLIPLPDDISGGKAMKLFPSIQLQLKKTQLKHDGKVVGNEIKATTIKNRVYPPFQDATICIDYINGIQPYAGLLDIGIVAGIVTQAGSWYSYGDIRLGQGSEKASSALGNYPQLLNDINKWLEKTKYSTINEKIKMAEEGVSVEIDDVEIEKCEMKIENIEQENINTEEVITEIETETKPKRKTRKKGV